VLVSFVLGSSGSEFRARFSFLWSAVGIVTPNAKRFRAEAYAARGIPSTAARSVHMILGIVCGLGAVPLGLSGMMSHGPRFR